MFTALYVFMPNTKVKLKHALISGILAGTAHQAFQFLYISSQLWVSRYNAIYGSFAALPMFLLWLQVSWTICLFGAELTYAGQNIRNFSFDKDARNISRRYRDFISILIMSLIAKRFADEKSEDIAYQPSMDINKMNVALLLDKLDTHGSEDFKIDKENRIQHQWGALLKAQGGILQECKQGAAAEGFVSTRKSFGNSVSAFFFLIIF